MDDAERRTPTTVGTRVRTVLGRVLRAPGLAVRALLLGLLWVYQNAVSPMLGPRCRYYPSCSNYAIGALRTHGAAKGTVLAVARVCRCNPWTPGGVDPVPPKGRWRNPRQQPGHSCPDDAIDRAEMSLAGVPGAKPADPAAAPASESAS